MSPTRIALVADPHLCLTNAEHPNISLTHTLEITQAVMADLERRRPDLTIWMGDLTHEGTEAVRPCSPMGNAGHLSGISLQNRSISATNSAFWAGAMHRMVSRQGFNAFF